MSGGIYGRCHGCGSGRVLKSKKQQTCPKCGQVWGTFEVRINNECARHDARGMRIGSFDHAQIVVDIARYELTLGTWDRSRYSKKLQSKFLFKDVAEDYIQHMEKCRMKLLEILKPVSVRPIFGRIGGLLSWATRFRLIDRRPAMPQTPIPQSVVSWLDTKFRIVIWDHLPDAYRPFLDFLRYHGTRLKDAIQLNVVRC